LRVTKEKVKATGGTGIVYEESLGGNDLGGQGGAGFGRTVTR